ncbi:MAG: hypothetical protein RIB32_02745 [Phycisphaerales bacterium]
MVRWLLLVIVFGCAPIGRAAEVAQTLAKAEEAFARGVSLVESDESSAEAAFLEAARAYDEITMRPGFNDRPRLHYNAANAYFLAGDLGRSIASYRRAAELAPSDGNIARNLATARSEVAIRLSVEADTSVIDTLLEVPRATPLWLRIAFLGSCWLGLWTLVGLRLAGLVRRPALWPAAALALLSVLLFGATYGEQWLASHAEPGVIVADRVVGRNGPGDAAYEPTFERPLVAGVEVEILERRAGWLRVRLADGRETWVNERSVESIWNNDRRHDKHRVGGVGAVLSD